MVREEVAVIGSQCCPSLNDDLYPIAVDLPDTGRHREQFPTQLKQLPNLRQSFDGTKY